MDLLLLRVNLAMPSPVCLEFRLRRFGQHVIPFVLCIYVHLSLKASLTDGATSSELGVFVLLSPLTSPTINNRSLLDRWNLPSEKKREGACFVGATDRKVRI